MNGRIPVAIREKRQVSANATQFVLEHASGDPLPSFTPGAHITVVAPNGLVRSYSLTDADAAGEYYAIAVQREVSGRGGSLSLIDDTRIGDQLEIGAPTNAFPLVEADDYLFIAGGIGITPIRALRNAVLERRGVRVRMLYLVRHAEDAAFIDELLDTPDCVLRVSSTQGRADLWPYLEEPGNTRLYCCGSQALMDEVRELTMHWNPNRVHFEDFSGPEARAAEVRFTAVWEPTGAQIEVDRSETILDALRRHSVPTLSSCQTGTCGTCIMKVVDGEADHRDVWLDDDSRTTHILPCVSRAASDSIRLAPVVS